MTEPQELPAPPVGEEIHMPEPSLLPLATAFGTAVGVVGLARWWPFVGVGALCFFMFGMTFVAAAIYVS